MAKEILKDEILSDEELDNVAGGTSAESQADIRELQARGLYSAQDMLRQTPASDILHEMGYTNCAGSFLGDNIYIDKKGNKVSREQFWEIFDADRDRGGPRGETGK